MNTIRRLFAVALSIAITGALLQGVFIAADAPDSQVVREARARQQTAPTVVAQRGASAALPQFADAGRFTR